MPEIEGRVGSGSSGQLVEGPENWETFGLDSRPGSAQRDRVEGGGALQFPESAHVVSSPPESLFNRAAGDNESTENLVPVEARRTCGAATKEYFSDWFSNLFSFAKILAAGNLGYSVYNYYGKQSCDQVNLGKGDSLAVAWLVS